MSVNDQERQEVEGDLFWRAILVMTVYVAAMMFGVFGMVDVAKDLLGGAVGLSTVTLLVVWLDNRALDNE